MEDDTGRVPKEPLRARSPWDAQWIDDRASAQMQGRNGNGNGNGNGDSAGSITLRWAHIGITLSLLAFVFGQYEKAQEWARTVAVNTERIAELREADARALLELRNMNARLENLAEEIRMLQRQVYETRAAEPVPPQKYRNSGSVR
jgi:uncharacterized coiled-coil protein SlyX